MNIMPQIHDFLTNIKDLTKIKFCHTSAYSFIKKLPNDTRVCIACSGGSDSVFLTLLFCAYFPNLLPNCFILHLNHNLRKQESENDEHYVKTLAKLLKLNCIVGKLKETNQHLSEDVLRDLRYRFFKTQMNAIASKILLLGQQQNDIVETLLMRLTRASGLDGLAAPHEICKFQDGHVRIRPLLHFKKSYIEDILTKFQIPWQIDSSNLKCHYFRNKIRNNVLPVLQKAAGHYDIVNNFAKSHEQIVEANEAIEILANKYLNDISLDTKIELSDFIELPSAILRRIINKWLIHNQLTIKQSNFTKLFHNIKSQQPIIVNCLNNEQLHFKDDALYITRNNKSSSKDAFQKFISWTDGSLCLPNNKILNKKTLLFEKLYIDQMKSCDINSEAYIEFTEKSITVKAFDPESYYISFGHKTPKKLKEIVGKNIHTFKNHPMLIIGHEICWIPGLPISEKFKLKEGTKRALLLTYL